VNLLKRANENKATYKVQRGVSAKTRQAQLIEYKSNPYIENSSADSQDLFILKPVKFHPLSEKLAYLKKNRYNPPKVGNTAKNATITEEVKDSSPSQSPIIYEDVNERYKVRNATKESIWKEVKKINRKLLKKAKLTKKRSRNITPEKPERKPRIDQSLFIVKAQRKLDKPKNMDDSMQIRSFSNTRDDSKRNSDKSTTGFSLISNSANSGMEKHPKKFRVRAIQSISSNAQMLTDRTLDETAIDHKRSKSKPKVMVMRPSFSGNIQHSRQLRSSEFSEKQGNGATPTKVVGGLAVVKERVFKPRTLIEKEDNLHAQELLFKKKREYQEWQIAVNITNLWIPAMLKLDSGLKFSYGPGNNSKLVYKLILDRGSFQLSDLWNGSNYVWTQTQSKRVLPSNYKSFLELANKGEFLAENGGLEKIKQTFISSKVYKIRTEDLLTELFENLETRPFFKYNDHSIRVSNHIKGIKHLSRKNLLAINIYEYAKKCNIDPNSMIPTTYFIREDDCESSIDSALQIIEQEYGFDDPWIIKPGEFSNRGKGISMGVGMDDIRKKVTELSENRKGACILLQRYLGEPLLYKKRKFDLRCYTLLIKSRDRASVYWYTHGYARTSSFEYDKYQTDNLMVHLTNEAVQVKCIPLY